MNNKFFIITFEYSEMFKGKLTDLSVSVKVKVMAEDRAEWGGKVFISEHFSRLPPLATTSCVIEDRGEQFLSQMFSVMDLIQSCSCRHMKLCISNC